MMITKEYINRGMIERSLTNTPQITFEVTDACNLNCVYCGYGKLYKDYDKRENKRLDPNKAKIFLDYLIGLWDTSFNKSVNNNIILSFYGGEPLMNVPFIETIVDYASKMKGQPRKFSYNMTTNGILLDRHIDFLVSKDFNLLISLDGDEFCNSYRINNDGQNSFKKVTENIEILRKQFPDYFAKRVNFNAVLHNRNSVADIYNYIKKKYNKIPRIGALNASGIRNDMKDEFFRMYQNPVDSLMQSENYGELENEMFLSSPTYHSAVVYLMQYSDFKYENYNELLYGKSEKRNIYPSGTCLPFSKKVFITVNGKILPCERIGHQFALGVIDNDSVNIDFDKIAQKYNQYFSKLDSQCTKCYNSQSCIQCIFNIQDIEKEKVKCNGFMNQINFESYRNAQLSFLENHPEAYARIMNDVLYR